MVMAQYGMEPDTGDEDSVVMLDDYNSDLNLVIDENGLVSHRNVFERQSQAFLQSFIYNNISVVYFHFNLG